MHRHDEADHGGAGLRCRSTTHRLELRLSRGVQREPAAVLAAAGCRRVRNADRPPEVSITPDEPGEGGGAVVDQGQRPGCSLVEGLLPPRFGRHHPPGLADDGDGNPGGGAPGGVGKLGPHRLELGFQLGDVSPGRAQLIGKPLDLVAGRCHRAQHLAIARPVFVCMRRRWYAWRARSAAASMLELERDASHVRFLLEIPT